MTWGWQIALAAFIAALIELVLHFIPWRLMLGRDLARPTAYILGVLGFLLPWTVLVGVWSIPPDYPLPCSEMIPADEMSRRLQIAMWAGVISAGLAVIGAYKLEHVLITMRRADELTELMEIRHEHRPPE